MALVNFKRGTKPSDVSSLDANTIYFFTDTKEIYLGSTPYGGDLSDLIKRITAAEGDIDTLEGTVAEIEGDIDDLQGDVASLEAWKAQHQTEYGTLSGKIDTLEAWKTSHSTEYSTLNGKVGTLEENYEALEEELDKKLVSLTAANASVTVGGTDTAKTIQVAISSEDDNVLELKSDGLYVNVEGLPETALTDYTVSVGTAATATQGYAKTYEIKQGAAGKETVVGKIDIPKDLVVSSGSVVVDADDDHEGAWIKLVLNNDDVIWIAAADLVDTVTANNGDAPVVSITVTDGTKISATLNNGTVTKAHLVEAVQTTLTHADEVYEALTWGSLA